MSLPCGASGSDCAAGATKPIEHKVGHIVEDPADISNLVDVEAPTEYYYEKYAQALRLKHPKASPDVL